MKAYPTPYINRDFVRILTTYIPSYLLRVICDFLKCQNLRAKHLTLMSTLTLVLSSAQGAVSTSTSTFSMSDFKFPSLKPSYFAWALTDRNNFNAGGANVGMYHYFALAHNFSEDQKIALRMPFFTNFGGRDETGQIVKPITNGSDVLLVYYNYRLIEPTNVTKATGSFNFYLPTTPGSRERGMITRFKAWMIFDYYLPEKWTIAYHSKPDLYVNSNTGMSSVDSNGKMKYSVNNIGEYDHYIEISRPIGSLFKPYFDVGHIHSVSYADARDTKQPWINKGKVGFGTWIFAHKSIKFIANMESISTFDNRGSEPFGYFRSKKGLDTTNYNLYTFIDL